MQVPVPPPRPLPKETMHLVHAILTVVTFGLWLPLWILNHVALRVGNEKRERAYARAMGQYEMDRLHYTVYLQQSYQQKPGE